MAKELEECAMRRKCRSETMSLTLRYKQPGKNKTKRPTLSDRLNQVRERRERALNRQRLRQVASPGRSNVCSEFHQAMREVGRSISTTVKGMNPFSGPSY